MCTGPATCQELRAALLFQLLLPHVALHSRSFEWNMTRTRNVNYRFRSSVPVCASYHLTHPGWMIDNDGTIDYSESYSLQNAH